MKYSIVFILCVIFFNANAQDYRLYAGPEFFVNSLRVQAGDTINKRDIDKKKDGLWVFTDKASGNVLSAGYYKANKKEGFWVKFDSNGHKLSEFQYKNGRPNGIARVFYTNGNVQEEGLWKGTTWVGAYKYFYENGNPCYSWNYNNDGQRIGEQRYYHENGQIKIEGTWVDGKKEGVLKEYYDNGSIKSEKVFMANKMDENTIKVYAKIEPEVVVVVENVTQDSVLIDENATENNLTFGVFNPNGYNKLFNIKFNKIEKEGYFQNGRLYTGKQYIYDEEGGLVRLVEYKESKIIEDQKFELDSLNK